MALNVGLEVPLDDIQDWKGIRDKAGKVKSTEADVTKRYGFPTNYERVLTLVLTEEVDEVQKVRGV
jgi:hypothetical protein